MLPHASFFCINENLLKLNVAYLKDKVAQHCMTENVCVWQYTAFINVV